jgi:hypothetical protein
MQSFIVAYDYGMGGLWGVLDAPSESAIREVYPELAVVHKQPAWMTDSQLERMKKNERYNLNDPPHGMLKALLADRIKKKENSGNAR